MISENFDKQPKQLNQDEDRPGKEYTLGEEIASSITHGIGTGLSIAALSVLVVLASIYGDAWKIVSFSIYGATLIILYLASTLYHAIPNVKAKQFFRTMDHISIFFLIAGTYTPYTLVTLRGPIGWTLFGLIWALAIIGMTLTILKVHRKHPVVSVSIYLLMGWLIVFAFKPLVSTLPRGGLALLIAGGLSYTFGVIFYALDKKLPYNHPIWHLFVLGGSACHFFSILLYVL